MQQPVVYGRLYLWYRKARMAASITFGITVLLPIHAGLNFFPFLRADPRWSFGRALLVPFVRWLMVFRKANEDILNWWGTREPLQERLDQLGAVYEVLPAWHGELKGRVAEWAAQRNVERVSVPCYWFGGGIAPGSPAQPAAEDERVLLSFHGGGYVTGSAHPDDPTAYPYLRLSRVSKTIHRALAVEYRLSSLPAGSGLSINPFPTALVDALTAFHHLISLGFQASNIYVAGDSAGGNLAFGLCYYLFRDEGIHIGGLIMISPWCDMSASHSLPNLTRRTNYNTDIIGDGVEPGSRAYLAFLGGPASLMSPNTLYVSPSCFDIEPPLLAGWPRTFISMGEDEQFLDEGRTLHRRVEKWVTDEDSAVLDVTPAMTHDFSASEIYEPERIHLMERLIDWVDRA